jgi:hypothetical protein
MYNHLNQAVKLSVLSFDLQIISEKRMNISTEKDGTHGYENFPVPSGTENLATLKIFRISFTKFSKIYSRCVLALF